MTETKKKVELTERGRLVAERAREATKENKERNNGEFVREPWYARYLSPNFEVSRNNTNSNTKLTAEDMEEEDELETEGDEYTEEDEDYDENKDEGEEE